MKVECQSHHQSNITITYALLKRGQRTTYYIGSHKRTAASVQPDEELDRERKRERESEWMDKTTFERDDYMSGYASIDKPTHIHIDTYRILLGRINIATLKNGRADFCS